MAKSALLRWLWIYLALIVAWGAFLSMRSVPAVYPTVYKVEVPNYAPAQLPWPTYGQAAIGAKGYGLLATHGEQTARPIASVAKVITALAVLKEKPLPSGQQGPTITLTEADVESYRNYLSQDGSVVPVLLGEQISEYQALQALLLPSANNMAYSLAVWAFGSLDNYVTFANQMLQDMGLAQTHVADASGFSPESVSSAQDLVKLAEAVLSHPVLAQIVSQEQAEIPVAGIIRNTNWLLNSEGIVGIKTGNTDQAGGCFMFAANRVVFGSNVTVFGAVMNAPDLISSMATAKALVRASDSGFEKATIVRAGQLAAIYRTPWGLQSSATAEKELSLLVWRGQKISISQTLEPLASAAAPGGKAGIISVKAGTQSKNTSVVLQNSLPQPSLGWRLTRSL